MIFIPYPCQYHRVLKNLKELRTGSQTGLELSKWFPPLTPVVEVFFLHFLIIIGGGQV
jgi:hypothetical protein